MWATQVSRVFPTAVSACVTRCRTPCCYPTPPSRRPMASSGSCFSGKFFHVVDPMARSRSQSFATLDSPTPLLPHRSWLSEHSYHPTLGIATPYRYSQSPSHVSIVRVLRNNASRQATFRFWFENLRIGAPQLFCDAKARAASAFFWF